MKKICCIKNKGVAMITVMIAVLFLSVIATTLLYISASNYAMKASNILGKENFYETDATLMKTSTSIRNELYSSISGAKNVSSLGSVVNGVDEDDIKLDEFDDSSKTYGSGKYNVNAIAKLVYPTECASIDDSVFASEVNVTLADGDVMTLKSDSCKITKDDNKTKSSIKTGVCQYTLHDIEIIQTSKNDYQNSVKTDLVFDIYEKKSVGGATGGVGNMSMLLDAPLKSDVANFKNLTMTGNCFVADYKKTGNKGQKGKFYDGSVEYVCPGENGLVMTNHSRLNMCGSNNVIYGDLRLSGSSSLCVYGDLTVYGDIIIKDQATLIVSDGGNVYQMEDVPSSIDDSNAYVLPGRKQRSCKFDAVNGSVFPKGYKPLKTVKASSFSSFADAVNLSDEDKFGLTYNIFAEDVIEKDGGDIKFDGKRVIELQDEVEFDKLKCNTASSGLDNSNFDLGRGYMLKDNKFGCDKFGIGFIQYKTNVANFNQDHYDHRLMICYNLDTIYLQQTIPYTTFIAKSPISCSQAHCVMLSKVGTTQFNYMTAAKGDDESKVFNDSSNPFNDVDIEFGSGDDYHFQGEFGRLFNKECNGYVDQMFGASLPDGGSSTTTYPADTISFSNYVRDYVE